MKARHEAGETVECVITFLEMTARPDYPYPHAPSIPGLALIHAEDPPVRWFMHLYDSVGAPYEWTDWHERTDAERAAFVGSPDTHLWTLMLTGWSAGFFMLDYRETGVCDLSYFGLTPEAVGRGVGAFLLKTAVLTGWDGGEIGRMTVNTCTLDHPRALGLYQKAGFTPFRRETRRKTLTRAREL